MTDNSLRTLLMSCPSIASLSLAHLPFITDRMLSSTASQLANLTILSLNGCTHVADSSVIALANHCKKLTSLSLFSLNITDESVKAITTNCTELTSLSISGCTLVTDVGGVTIAQLKSLVSLYLNAATITDVTPIAVSHACRKLRALSLNKCVELTDRSIMSLALFCSHIQSLSMNECGITTVSVKTLYEHCIDLRELSVKGCPHVVFDGPLGNVDIPGNGGMQHHHAVGLTVLQDLMKRRIALLR